MIVVPVHEEDGWIANSPGEAAKARLEAHSPPKGKSPEALQAASERAQALHQLHIESVKMRAKRDLERVREAERRRLRASEAEKQRIVEKAAASEKHLTEKKEALEAQAAEKRARREALKQAFFDSRASMAAAANQRELELAERHGQAAAKRNKLLQATVSKANYEVKHAIAVATAAKENQRAATVAASASIEARMEAAAVRRNELLSSPPSPGKEGPKKSFKTSRERARQVAQVLNDEACALETKRKALSDAMEKALVARDARIEATVRRAAICKERSARAKATLAARAAGLDELKHQIVEKGQAAEVRRALFLKAPSTKKLAPCALDFDFKRAAAVPPADLVARLSAKPVFIAEEASARHQRAATNRERVLLNTLTKLTARANCAAAAAGRREAVLEARIVKLAVKQAKALTATATRAPRTLERAGAAESKRTAARYIQLGVLLAKAQKREQAATKRTALARATAAADSRLKRAAAVEARRKAQDEATAAKGEVKAKGVTSATERRAAVLSGRVARAKMSAIRRNTAVKLTTAAGGVQVAVEGEAPKAAEKTSEEAAAVGFVGRVFGRFFGM